MIHHGKEMAASLEARFQYYGEKIHLHADSPQGISHDAKRTGTPWLNGLNILLPSEGKVKILHFCAILATFHTG